MMNSIEALENIAITLVTSGFPASSCLISVIPSSVT